MRDTSKRIKLSNHSKEQCNSSGWTCWVV